MSDAHPSVADSLRNRITPAALTTPAPDEQTLRLAFEAAMAAPDHGNVRALRFILIERDRLEQFGAMLGEALKQRSPEADMQAVEREVAKARRSPLIVVAAAKLQDRRGVPHIEQLLATAAAVQNFSSVLYARGFAATWKTGEPAYDPFVKQKLGLEPADAIVGFLYVGTPTTTPRRVRSNPDQHVRIWAGPT